MFTGLIQEIGKVKRIIKETSGIRLLVLAPMMAFEGKEGVKIGDSIALNGVCQTVTSLFDGGFEVFSMNETVKCSNFNTLSDNYPLNLERAMKITDRFDGHIVQGHIDTVCKVENIRTNGLSTIFTLNGPTKLIVQKGSITLNGVSLTVSKLEDSLFEVSLIPHTLKNTIFQYLKVKDILNVEYDILGKYVEKFLNLNHNESEIKNKSQIDEKFLLENGF